MDNYFWRNEFRVGVFEEENLCVGQGKNGDCVINVEIHEIFIWLCMQ